MLLVVFDYQQLKGVWKCSLLKLKRYFLLPKFGLCFERLLRCCCIIFPVDCFAFFPDRIRDLLQWASQRLTNVAVMPLTTLSYPNVNWKMTWTRSTDNFEILGRSSTSTTMWKSRFFLDRSGYWVFWELIVQNGVLIALFSPDCILLLKYRLL